MAKVTVYIDDETWAHFKRKVLRRTGTLRRISEELQAVVQDSLVEETLVAAFRDLGYEVRALPAASQLARVRPHRRTSAAQVVRELRARRHGATLPRQ